MQDLDIFDHRRWSGFSDTVIVNKFKKASKFIGYSNVPKTYVDEFLKLLKDLKADPLELCEKIDSSPRLAWTVIFDRYPVTEFLRKVVLTAAIIPFGTAEGEY